jgi:hypothetical protein
LLLARINERLYFAVSPLSLLADFQPHAATP